ncbi:MAG TPA: TonB-dependent receptor [Sphingobium sp.]|uniref:TonB-dependent receptor n=1 Tax=Sphingobium sp. TaxID=1912891 RepID=UPI002ED41614
MTIRTTRSMLRAAILASGAVLSSPALAQNSPAPAQATADAAGDNDIIVTAQRRAERLESVPLAITAVSGETLERTGVRQLGNIGQIAAGVQVNRGGAFTQPSVRGVSTMVLGFGFENNVAVYVDGFYQSDAVSINGDLVNLSSMQILKGPQGTLYGRNATGGAIVIETLAPSNKLTASGEVSYGRFNDVRVKGYVSAPLTEGVKFSVAGFFRHSDSYIKNLDGSPATPTRNATVRTKLELDPLDNLTVTLGYNHVFSDDSRGLAYTYIGYYAYSAVPATAGRATTPGTLSSNVRPDASVRADEYTAKVKWDTSIGTLTSYTGYAHRLSHSIFDIDGSLAQLQGAYAVGINQDTFQQSLDYVINAVDRLDLVVGASYYNDVFNNRETQRYGLSLPPSAPDAYENIRSSSEAMAAYIDATLRIGDKLFVTGGARYHDERRTFQYTERPGYIGAVVLPNRSPVSASFSKVTPRAVLRYEIAPRTNVYASYTQGFRSGTFNIAVLPTAEEAGRAVRPEKIDSYEIGFKTASSHFRFDAAAYYYNYRDLQVAVTATGPTRVILFNAPKAEIYGAEANASYTPLEDLHLRAGVAYVHARYKDFVDANGNPVAFGTGVTASGLNNTTQRQDWSNQQMARAPTWTFNAGLDYTVDAAGGRLTGTANASYTSSYVVTNPSLYGVNDPTRANQQRYRQGAYGLLNVALSWTDPSERYTIGAYADNVTNTRYALVYSGSGLGDYKQYMDPVTYGVRLGFKY